MTIPSFTIIPLEMHDVPLTDLPRFVAPRGGTNVFRPVAGFLGGELHADAPAAGERTANMERDTKQGQSLGLVHI